MLRRLDVEWWLATRANWEMGLLGFVVVPRQGEWVDRLAAIAAKMTTLSLVDRMDCGPMCVLFYSTTQANNYRVDGADGKVYVACGTLMMGRLRGQGALQAMTDRLGGGASIDEVYVELRGPFSVLCADPGAGNVTLLTDRDGLMCVWRTQDATPVFSSSLLVLASMCATELDELGIQEFVHGGACVGGRSMFQGIGRVAKASVVALAAAGAPERLLWAPTVLHPCLPDSDEQIVDRMSVMFATAVDTELPDNGKVFAADLTAGTDSRTVLSFLVRTGQPLVASSAGPQGSVDVVTAQKIARRAGIEHYWYEAQNTVEFDDGTLDQCIELSDAALNPFGLTKQAPYFAEKVKRFDMLFGGNGGPLFKDHYWLFEFNRIGREAEPNWERIARYSLTEGKVNQALFEDGVDYLDHMRKLFMAWSSRVKGTNNQKLDFMYFDFKCQYFAAPAFSFTNKFMDVYHPMCDARLVEYSWNIRPQLRLRARLQSEMIYRNDPSIAWILTDNYVPCVPDTGWRSFIRLTRGVRYARAIRRKIRDFVLNHHRVGQDQRALTFVASLRATSMGNALTDPASMVLGPLLNQSEVKRLVGAALEGAHSGYLQRLFGAEAIVRKVQSLGGQRLAAPSL